MNVVSQIDSMLTADGLKEHCQGQKPYRVMIPWDVMYEPENPAWKEFDIEIIHSRAGNPDANIRNCPYDYVSILFAAGPETRWNMVLKTVTCRRCIPA